ncbi:MAG: hypothetical protein WC389_21130 [Lutibacter sp.]|jgi:hypothetical protein
MKIFSEKKICQLLFLYNLSQWHYSAVLSFSKYWQNVPNKLSNEEKQSLIIWQTLEIENAKKNGNFIIEKYIGNKLSFKDKKQINSCLAIFKKRFEYHYKKQEKNIANLRKYLQLIPLDSIIKKTSAIYNQKIALPNTYVTLSHNANKEAGGMMLANKVILQFGDYKWEKNNESILSLWFHEITHSASVKSLLPANFDIKLPAKFTGNKIDYIDEIIHQTLWGQIGILSQVFFNLSDNEITVRKNNLIKQRVEPFKTMIEISYLLGRYIKKQLKTDPNFSFSKLNLKEIIIIVNNNSIR